MKPAQRESYISGLVVAWPISGGTITAVANTKRCVRRDDYSMLPPIWFYYSVGLLLCFYDNSRSWVARTYGMVYEMYRNIFCLFYLATSSAFFLSGNKRISRALQNLTSKFKTEDPPGCGSCVVSDLSNATMDCCLYFRDCDTAVVWYSAWETNNFLINCINVEVFVIYYSAAGRSPVIHLSYKKSYRYTTCNYTSYLYLQIVCIYAMELI